MSEPIEHRQLPFEHPYWDPRGVIQLHEFGFERDYLIMLAEQEPAVRNRVVREVRKIAAMLKEGYQNDFAPEHIAYMLLQTAERDCHRSFMDRIINDRETVDLFAFDEGFTWEIYDAYHPDNRLLLRPFKPGVDEDGTIHDAPGPFSEQRGLLVDQHGGLHELRFGQGS